MRGKVVVLIVLIMAALGGWLALRTAGPRRPSPEPGPAPSERRSRVGKLPDGGTAPAEYLDLAYSVRAAFSRGDPLPSDVKLEKLSVVEHPNGEKECILEVTENFSKVNRIGSTGEAQAQDALRRALAGFDKVDTVTVKVNGEVFEGAHAGPWERIPVRGPGLVDGG